MTFREEGKGKANIGIIYEVTCKFRADNNEQKATFS